MAEEITIRVNDKLSNVTADRDTPLLYVLTNELRLQGPRFGCGLAQCGSCSVLADGVEIRSCVTPVGDSRRQGGDNARRLAVALRSSSAALAQPPRTSSAAAALVDEQAPQCGYCYNGMTIKGAELLAHRTASRPMREIRAAHERPSLPLRQLSADHEGDPARLDRV